MGRDIEAEVTARMVDALERGTVPWQRPWTSAAGLMPTSATTGKPYRGVNVWLLSLTAMEHGYASPYWLTFNQCKTLGGTVRKGQKGTVVVFWKMLDRTEQAADGTERARKVPLLRYYHVFNVEQCDDVKLPPRFTMPEEREPLTVSDAVRAVIDGYANGPAIRHAPSDRAYYSPMDDAITLPALEQWTTETGYAGTLFHELTHSTGHPSRLDRFARNGEPQHFGSQQYAREELVAEMGAAILAASTGIDCDFPQSAAYVASWLRALSDDRSLVLKAAQQAQRATDRILGTTFEERTESETETVAA